MRQSISILLLSLILSGLSACKQSELPPGETGDVVFYLNGRLGNDAYASSAGKDGIYMYTGFEQDTLGIYSFTGNFASEGCPDCPGSLRIRLRDDQKSDAGVSLSPDDILQSGTREYYYKDPGSSAWQVAYTTQSSGSGPVSQLWFLGDGNRSVEPNPTHVYLDSTLTEIRVCLESEDANGCKTVICNDIKLSATDCRADFSHELVSADFSYVEFESESTGKAPLKYRWDFGDGYSASLGNPGYFFTTPGRYTVCLTVEDADGCTSTMCKNIAADPLLCANNFSYEVSKTVVKDEEQFTTVIVEWTDDQGRVFSSADKVQSNASYFEVLSREPYDLNERGEQTLKLKVKFACTLINGSELLEIDGMEGYIGVSFP